MNEVTPESAKAAKSLLRLRGEFPLEARLAGAGLAARTTYARILACWVGPAAPPLATDFPARDVAELVALDAVALAEEGVCAYPFSARDTGISVRLRGRRVSAMCAIDALAVSMLADAAVTIEATCEGCRKSIALVSHPDGRWETPATSAIRVRHPGRRDRSGPCCSDLCPMVRFVFAGCESGCADDYLDLGEAVAVARGLFAFQVPLIQAERQGPTDTSA